jgi:hypothetical protein
MSALCKTSIKMLSNELCKEIAIHFLIGNFENHTFLISYSDNYDRSSTFLGRPLLPFNCLDLSAAGCWSSLYILATDEGLI